MLTTLLICKAYIALNQMYVSHMDTPREQAAIGQVINEVKAECEQESEKSKKETPVKGLSKEEKPAKK